MALPIQIDQGQDGRFIVDLPLLPGVMAYGATRDEALAKAKALALRVLASNLSLGELTFSQA